MTRESSPLTIKGFEGGPVIKLKAFFLVMFFIGVAVFCGRLFKDNKQTRRRAVLSREMVANFMGPSVKELLFPDEIEVFVEAQRMKAAVAYTINERSQELSEKLLETYKPDYGAMVALDAETGKILAMSSYSRDHLKLGNLALRSTFPAASVFKMVTAAAAIDQRKLSSGTIIPFNGRSHTLYRKNVEDTKKNRWTRYMTLKEAFGHSVNTVFAKLGLFYVGPQTLSEYAERFKFNTSVPADVQMGRGLAYIPTDDDWAVAETASGFTQSSTMSPLQGALMAAAVANDGIMMEPYLVENLTTELGETLYEANPAELSVTMTPASAAELRVLMRETVLAGTSRKTFRKIVGLKKIDQLEIGGKTGSLTGLDPKGKYDWFVGYARLHGERVAIAALTINESKWRVKSSYLAGRFFEDYVKQIAQRKELVSIVPGRDKAHYSR